MNDTNKDIGQEIIFLLKELGEQLDQLIKALKNGRKELSDTLNS